MEPLMRYALWTLLAAAWCTCVFPSAADDAPRFAERAPLPKIPPTHTQQRAGNPASVAWWAIPGRSRYDTGGYVGGATLHGNRPLAQGVGAATGPTTDG